MTAACSSSKTCKEVNPILAPLVNKGYYGLAGGLKAGVDTAAVILIRKYTKPRSKERYIALSLAVTLKAGIVVFNSVQLRANK